MVYVLYMVYGIGCLCDPVALAVTSPYPGGYGVTVGNPGGSFCGIYVYIYVYIHIFIYQYLFIINIDFRYDMNILVL